MGPQAVNCLWLSDIMLIAFTSRLDDRKETEVAVIFTVCILPVYTGFFPFSIHAPSSCLSGAIVYNCPLRNPSPFKRVTDERLLLVRDSR